MSKRNIYKKPSLVKRVPPAGGGCFVPSEQHQIPKTPVKRQSQTVFTAFATPFFKEGFGLVRIFRPYLNIL